MNYRDLVKGNYYYVENTYYEWVLQYGVCHIYTRMDDKGEFMKVNTEKDHFQSLDLVFRNAILDEVEWIEQCKAEGKFVEKNINYEIY